MVSIASSSARHPASNSAPSDLALAPALPWIVGGGLAIWTAAATYYSTPVGQRASSDAGTLLVQTVCEAIQRLQKFAHLTTQQLIQLQAHVTKLLGQATNPVAFFESIRELPSQISGLLQFNTGNQTQPSTRATAGRGSSPAPQGEPPGVRMIPPTQEHREQPCAAGAPVCVRGNPQIAVAQSQQRLEQRITALNQRLKTLQQTSYRPALTDLVQDSEAKQWQAFSQQVSAAKAALATLERQASALGNTASTELKQFLNQATATLQAMPQKFLKAKAHVYARAVQAVEQAMKLGQALPYGTHAQAYKTLGNFAQWYSAQAGLNQFSRESRAGFEARVGAYLQPNRNKAVPQGSAPAAQVSASPQELEKLVEEQWGNGELAQEILKLAQENGISAEELAAMKDKTANEVLSALRDGNLGSSGIPPGGGTGRRTTTAAGASEPDQTGIIQLYTASLLDLDNKEIARLIQQMPALPSGMSISSREAAKLKSFVLTFLFHTFRNQWPLGFSERLTASIHENPAAWLNELLTRDPTTTEQTLKKILGLFPATAIASLYRSLETHLSANGANSRAQQWNKIDREIGHYDYPETLRQLLAQLNIQNLLVSNPHIDKSLKNSNEFKKLCLNAQQQLLSLPLFRNSHPLSAEALLRLMTDGTTNTHFQEFRGWTLQALAAGWIASKPNNSDNERVTGSSGLHSQAAVLVDQWLAALLSNSNLHAQLGLNQNTDLKDLESLNHDQRQRLIAFILEQVPALASSSLQGNSTPAGGGR